MSNTIGAGAIIGTVLGFLAFILALAFVTRSYINQKRRAAFLSRRHLENRTPDPLLRHDHPWRTSFDPNRMLESRATSPYDHHITPIAGESPSLQQASAELRDEWLSVLDKQVEKVQLAMKQLGNGANKDRLSAKLPPNSVSFGRTKDESTPDTRPTTTHTHNSTTQPYTEVAG